MNRSRRGRARRARRATAPRAARPPPDPGQQTALQNLPLPTARAPATEASSVDSEVPVTRRRSYPSETTGPVCPLGCGGQACRHTSRRSGRRSLPVQPPRVRSRQNLLAGHLLLRRRHRRTSSALHVWLGRLRPVNAAGGRAAVGHGSAERAGRPRARIGTVATAPSGRRSGVCAGSARDRPDMGVGRPRTGVLAKPWSALDVAAVAGERGGGRATGAAMTDRRPRSGPHGSSTTSSRRRRWQVLR